MFRSTRNIEGIVRASLDGVLAGIKHLHSLDLVHNDINPSNIMFDEDYTPLLIDFGSCREIGESLHDAEVSRTPYWHDPEVGRAEEKNDLDAFEELRVWLVGGEEEKFLFTKG